VPHQCQTAGDAILRSDGADGDMKGVAREQDLGTTQNMGERAVLLQFSDFVGGVLLSGICGRVLLRRQSHGRQEGNEWNPDHNVVQTLVSMLCRTMKI
jgi:hypothetical protein